MLDLSTRPQEMANQQRLQDSTLHLLRSEVRYALLQAINDMDIT